MNGPTPGMGPPRREGRLRTSRSGWAALAVPATLAILGLVVLLVLTQTDPGCRPQSCCSQTPNGTICCAGPSSAIVSHCSSSVAGLFLLFAAALSVVPAVLFWRSRRYRPLP